MTINKLCRSCRSARTQCDMIAPDGAVRTCSRCKRLGIQCVPEQDHRKTVKASTVFKNGFKMRLRGEEPGLSEKELTRRAQQAWLFSDSNPKKAANEAATLKAATKPLFLPGPLSALASSSCVPAAGLARAVPTALASSSCVPAAALGRAVPTALARVPPAPLPVPMPVSADAAVYLGKATGAAAAEMTKLVVLGCSGKLTDRPALLYALHVLLHLAAARDCCGLAAFALQSAHQLRFPLSDVKTSAAEGHWRSRCPLPIAVPEAVSGLFNSPCLVSVRSVAAGRYWSLNGESTSSLGVYPGWLPNPHFAEHLSSPCSMDFTTPVQSMASGSPPRLVDADEERERFAIAFCRGAERAAVASRSAAVGCPGAGGWRLLAVHEAGQQLRPAALEAGRPAGTRGGGHPLEGGRPAHALCAARVRHGRCQRPRRQLLLYRALAVRVGALRLWSPSAQAAAGERLWRHLPLAGA